MDAVAVAVDVEHPEAVVLLVAADVVVLLAQRVVPRSSLYVAIDRTAGEGADC